MDRHPWSRAEYPNGIWITRYTWEPAQWIAYAPYSLDDHGYPIQYDPNGRRNYTARSEIVPSIGRAMSQAEASARRLSNDVGHCAPGQWERAQFPRGFRIERCAGLHSLYAARSINDRGQYIGGYQSLSSALRRMRSEIANSEGGTE